MRILGVDIGGSSTKMAEVEDGRILSMAGAPSSIPLDDLFDRDGQCVKCPDMDLRRVDRIVLTGAGSTSVKGSLRCLPTMSTDEFEANAWGARCISGLDRFVVVSIGTGTSFVKVDGPRYAHLGGLAIGGGTFSGLSNVIFGHSDMSVVAEMSGHGDADNVDLLIRDISETDLPGLPLDITASNFGKAGQNAAREDVAAGMVKMILQTIGSAANFVAQGTGLKDFVMIGNMVTLPQSRNIFDRLGDFYGLNFIVPEHPEYVTAFGAAISCMSFMSSRAQSRDLF